MKKSRFSEEQIIGFIKEAEAGMPVAELCRKHGFSDASFYKWRAKFGGMDVSEARRLRDLEGENAKLKKLLAEAHLDIEALKTAFRVKR
jgi:putative transposase